MNKKKVDPLLARWRSMNRRCSAPKTANYENYGALGITVAEIWNTTNSEGFKNYTEWVKQELNKIPPEQRKDSWRVVRRCVTKEFSPANCYITSQLVEVQRRAFSEWRCPVFEDRRKANVPVSNYNHAKALAVKKDEHKPRPGSEPASWFSMLILV